MTKDEALKLAQDYLTDHQIGVHIITAIEQALAAPVQEPIKWTNKMSIDVPDQELYTTKPNVATPLDETASLAAQDLQTELEATNRQVEILSDALAESRREVAAQRQSAPDPKDRRSAWVGLTDEESIHLIENEALGRGELVEAVEALLKAKNG